MMGTLQQSLCRFMGSEKGEMSAIGTKRTWACALQMSAIRGKKDISAPFRKAHRLQLTELDLANRFQR